MTNLKYLRMAKGLSQFEAAHQLGINSTYLSRLENGWMTRPPKGCEEKLRALFGDEWTFAKLMEEVRVK